MSLHQLIGRRNKKKSIDDTGDVSFETHNRLHMQASSPTKSSFAIEPLNSTKGAHNTSQEHLFKLKPAFSDSKLSKSKLM